MIAAQFSHPGIVRPLRSLIDPRPEHCDLLPRERLPLGRHERIRFQPADEMDQATLRAPVRHNHLSLVPTLESRRLIVQPQATLLFFRSVAVHAMFRQ